ncbi:hypothetical protein ACFSX9_05755 [Flavobacterium ardleyense]|uniref:Lipoprotein n=1 Tax=Flavobacterium ardleyense TaxID=2038737 RepID=A0ABW5Z5Y2_9FLAO
MKKSLTLFFAISILFACGQEKKSAITSDKEKLFIIQNPDINSKNFVLKLLEKVKHYHKEPIYYMRIGKANCVIEVLVNDYPIHNDYELSNYATPIEINHCILKSGKQKLTYRLYPTGDLMKESYGGDEETVTTLTDFTSVSIKIIQMDNKGEQKLKDEVVVMQHNSLSDKSGKFVASGKPYYEYTFEFQAEVPYNLEGWTKGQDLTKLDEKMLEKKALDFHNMYQKIYENQDADALAKIEFNAIKRQALVYYYNKEDITEMWNEVLKILLVKNKTFESIDQYKIVFFGDKKILMLMQKNLNIEFRGFGMFNMKYINESGVNSSMLSGIDLSLPEGKRLENGLYVAG